MAVAPRGDLLAAADDSGQVAVVSLSSRALVKTLRRQHTNIASCVAWRPNRAGELLSAGLDSRVIAWDAPNGRVRRDAAASRLPGSAVLTSAAHRRRSWDTAEVLAEVEARESGAAAHSSGGEQLQMCNPPLAHSVRCCHASLTRRSLLMMSMHRRMPCSADSGCARLGCHG